MDTTTFFLIIIILTAVVLIAVGVYLILILHEARTTLRRTNKILDHVDSVLDILDNKIARPASSLIGVVGVVKEALDLVRDFTSKRKDDHEQREEPRQQ